MAKEKPPMVELPFQGRLLKACSIWNMIRTIRMLLLGV